MKTTNTNQILTIDQKKALYLHINERLYVAGTISKSLYDAAKLEIIKIKE